MIKSLKIGIAIVALVLLVSSFALAAGTVAITYSESPDSELRYVTLSWVADAAAATVPSTALSTKVWQGSLTVADFVEHYYLCSAETDPGSTAPTANYDIVFNDASGMDVFGGRLANRSATATEEIWPYADSTATAVGCRFINSDLTMVISNNAVNSATGTVTLKFAAP